MPLPAPSPEDRGLPECRCPANCGGHPELFTRLTPAYPSATAEGSTPPELPYNPRQRGELIYDNLNQRSGAFMDRNRQLVYLRPERGGQEWEVDAKWLTKSAP
ncbi:hypothetical protein ACFYNO_16255 [Kitasatospora sp. NPDC006697]|uniref:hypothetical protein n=1 Tax=Kitasatospora sp. NPDC006697 TaxID=3364020 RepID=UPI0036BB5AD5